MNQTPITIQAIIHAPLEKIWRAWTEPDQIVQWAFAQDDWEAPSAENDIRTGGKFKTVMASKDKTQSFDFTGIYTEVKEQALIEYEMDDGRRVRIEFNSLPDGVKIVQTFDPEQENTIELQRSGWQAILDNFKKHVEGQSKV
jgi:uncharacterized protein YndB with AHSA1/START domain